MEWRKEESYFPHTSPWEAGIVLRGCRRRHSWGPGKSKEFLDDQSWAGAWPFKIKSIVHVAISTPGKRILDYVTDLKKLFTEAYATENLSSAILIQHFLTGLLPPIRRQLLLWRIPEPLTQAIKDAVNTECALNFDGEADNSQEVNFIHHKWSTQESSVHNKLQESLDQTVKRLGALEMDRRQSLLSPTDKSHRNQPHTNSVSKREHEYKEPICWLCGETGHIKRQCPLNYNRPAWRVGGWPRPWLTFTGMCPGL